MSRRAHAIGLLLLLLGAAPMRSLGQDAPAPPAQAAVKVAVASEPADSAVFVRYGSDARDRFVGRTPLEAELAPGPAELVIYKDGFVCKVEPLELRSGGAARLEVRLTRDVEVPRGLVLKQSPAFVHSAEEGHDIYLALLGHVVRFYVEEKDPRALVETSVTTLVDVLNAVRSRELLLRRELTVDARRRYYGEELDLSPYPTLALTRTSTPAGKTRWALGAGTVGIEGETDPGDLDSYFGMLKKVYAFVRQRWDTRQVLSDAVLTHCLVEGLIAALDDDHTHFLGPRDVDEMAEQNTGEFGGVGLQVGVRDGVLTVIAPMPGTPAQRAGIVAGDVIEQIDGQDASRLSLSEAVKLMRGKVDTPVELRLRRGEGHRYTRTIVRANVKIKDTATRLLEGGIAYLRISSFMGETLHETIEAALDQFEAKGARALVIDLRNNPGGLLEEARTIADFFVPAGTIVSTRTRMPGENRTLSADPDVKKWRLPIAVLINEGSASASEILAGVLREHKLATLIGEKSFGKGSVQRVLPLDPYRCALALTVATYHLPSGATPHKVGITPDIVVTLTDEQKTALITGMNNYDPRGEDKLDDPQLKAAVAHLQSQLSPR